MRTKKTVRLTDDVSEDERPDGELRVQHLDGHDIEHEHGDCPSNC